MRTSPNITITYVKGSNGIACITIIVLLLFSRLAYCESDTNGNRIFANINKTVYLGAQHNPEFRGLELGDYGVLTAGDVSYLGVTAGLKSKIVDSDSNWLAYVSYSYAIEELILSSGLNYIDFTPNEQGEVFIEATGRERYWGYTPSLYISTGLDESSLYGELRISKNYYLGRYLLNPYFELGAGDYYSDEIKMNHLGVGVDTHVKINDMLFIAPHINVVIPMGGVEDTKDNADAFIQSGITLTIDF